MGKSLANFKVEYLSRMAKSHVGEDVQDMVANPYISGCLMNEYLMSEVVLLHKRRSLAWVSVQEDESQHLERFVGCSL